MLTDFMNVGGNEVLNQLRVGAYVTNLGAPLDFPNGAPCGCDGLTEEMLGDAPYVSPVADPAPWYDVDTPESGNFLGILVTSIDGLDGSTRRRNVTGAVGGGGVFGPSRELPRTITVNGVLIGHTCCGADYGLHWLQEALAGCTGDMCGGDCVTMYDCCPGEPMTEEEFRDRHGRTFVRTALVSGPTVIQRHGTGSCAAGCGGGELIEVEFVLVAASPTPWTELIPVLDVAVPVGGTGDCIEWCQGCSPSQCLFSECGPEVSACADPRVTVPTPPQPQIPTTGFCIPIGPERACYEVDLSDRPGWSSDVPVVTINSGSAELRNVRVVMYERPASMADATCEEVADSQRCAQVNEFYVTYIPANSAVTFDGRTGFATSECGGVCESATSAFGDQDGGPVRFNDLTCASYCLCVESDTTQPPAEDAMVSLSIAGRGL